MIRLALLVGAILVATPLAAQDHSAHGGNHAAQPEPEPEMDHCAMGHLPPEKCPPKDEPQPAPEPAMDHCAMGHLPPEKCPAKDCLLYTSPSPRDQRGSRMPSSA